MIGRIVYPLCAFVAGACVPLCALIFARFAGGSLGTADFLAYAAQAHIVQPRYYFIDVAPALLAIIAYFAGRAHDRATSATAKLRREVSVKTQTLSRIASDLEARKRLESQLAHQAFHDPITHLANRALFTNRTEHALVRAGSKKHEIAVLLIDLDDFKTVNDMLGHDLGDRVLMLVAQRMTSVTRPRDTLARLAGDEFALLLDRVASPQDALTMAQKLIDVLVAPVTLKDRRVTVGLSVGIAYGRAESRADSLLRDAGLAVNEAKSKGKNCLRVFRPEMHVALLERVKIGGELQTGLDRTEFFVMYQPIVDLHTRRIVGMEALVRWAHPKRGLIPPLEFIKLAEDTGAIVPLGAWVLKTACRQVAAWHRGQPTETPLSLTVNVSPIQLHHHGFIEDVRGAIVTAGLPPGSLVLEITESALVDDAPETIRLFDDLKTLGVRLAVDDFGTGYSSLSYLQRFPFDILKIDKSFVDGVAGGGTDSAFARTIVALGGMLELRVLAEGIEHEAQLDMLREMGCQYGQGYLFSKPLDAAGLTTLLDRTRVLAGEAAAVTTA